MRREQERRRGPTPTPNPSPDPASKLTGHEHGNPARARVQALEERLRVARQAHAAMPLTIFYRGGLVDVPLGQLLAGGRWAA